MTAPRPSSLERPAITLSTLARAMGPIAPAALVRLLAGHKYQASGPRRSYQNARRQAIDLLARDRPLDPDAPLRAHEREAITALARMRVQTPAWVRAVRPSPILPAWEIDGVAVSMQPDVEFEGRIASGAAKFVFTKERLQRGVASTMAALLWHHRRNVLGIGTTRRQHCIVYEPRLPWLHLPGRRPELQIRSAGLACKVIAALWPEL